VLTSEQLAELASDLENYHVERKRSMSDKSKIEEAICAFANDLPGSGKTGVLLVGVDDDGQPSHLPVTDQLLHSGSPVATTTGIRRSPAPWRRLALCRSSGWECPSRGRPVETTATQSRSSTSPVEASPRS